MRPDIAQQCNYHELSLVRAAYNAAPTCALSYIAPSEYGGGLLIIQLALRLPREDAGIFYRDKPCRVVCL